MLESLEYDLLKHAMIKMSFVTVVLKFNSETRDMENNNSVIDSISKLISLKKAKDLSTF